MPAVLGQGTPQDRLLRALLRVRDGDAAAAKVAFYSMGPLPANEPLVADLEKRMSAALEEIRVHAANPRSWPRGECFPCARRAQAPPDPVRAPNPSSHCSLNSGVP